MPWVERAHPRLAEAERDILVAGGALVDVFEEGNVFGDEKLEEGAEEGAVLHGGVVGLGAGGAVDDGVGEAGGAFEETEGVGEGRGGRGLKG